MSLLINVVKAKGLAAKDRYDRDHPSLSYDADKCALLSAPVEGEPARLSLFGTNLAVARGWRSREHSIAKECKSSRAKDA